MQCNLHFTNTRKVLKFTKKISKDHNFEQNTVVGDVASFTCFVSFYAYDINS